MALYHRGITNDVFGAVLDRVRADRGLRRGRAAAHAPSSAWRSRRRSGGDRARDHPARAVDGASLVAAADLVVSAGGTMNREAAALGVPVYTVFAGRMGGVDEQLLADGRLRLLASADDVRADAPRDPRGDAPRLLHDRAPRDLLDVLLRRTSGRSNAPRTS